MRLEDYHLKWIYCSLPRVGSFSRAVGAYPRSIRRKQLLKANHESSIKKTMSAQLVFRGYCRTSAPEPTSSPATTTIRPCPIWLFLGHWATAGRLRAPSSSVSCERYLIPAIARRNYAPLSLASLKGKRFRFRDGYLDNFYIFLDQLIRLPLLSNQTYS